MGTADLSVLDWWRIQVVRRLYAHISVDVTHHQQFVRDPYLHSYFPDRSQNARRTCRRLVSVDVGSVSVHLVLVGPLDLGHDADAADSGRRIPACVGVAGLAGPARMAAVRSALRNRCSRQSNYARVSSLLWAVDLAAAISPRPAFLGWRGVGVCYFLRSAVAVAGAELRSLRSLRLSPR